MRVRVNDLLVLSMVGLAIMIGGCRESAQPSPASTASDVQIEMMMEPETPRTGEAALLITVSDANGQSAEIEVLAVRGDMTHAGMVPVIADPAVEPDENNVYRVPFQWTMGGDWIVTVDVTLTDGRTARETFDVVVES